MRIRSQAQIIKSQMTVRVKGHSRIVGLIMEHASCHRSDVKNLEVMALGKCVHPCLRRQVNMIDYERHCGFVVMFELMAS